MSTPDDRLRALDHDDVEAPAEKTAPLPNKRAWVNGRVDGAGVILPYSDAGFLYSGDVEITPTGIQITEPDDSVVGIVLSNEAREALRRSDLWADKFSPNPALASEHFPSGPTVGTLFEIADREALAYQREELQTWSDYLKREKQELSNRISRMHCYTMFVAVIGLGELVVFFCQHR